MKMEKYCNGKFEFTGVVDCLVSSSDYINYRVKIRCRASVSFMVTYLNCFLPYSRSVDNFSSRPALSSGISRKPTRASGPDERSVFPKFFVR